MCAAWCAREPASTSNRKCASSENAHERAARSEDPKGPRRASAQRPTLGTEHARYAQGGGGMTARNELGKVAVLMGGPSSEREISFLSGNAVLAALHEKDVDAHAFDPAVRDLFELKSEG